MNDPNREAGNETQEEPLPSGARGTGRTLSPKITCHDAAKAKLASLHQANWILHAWQSSVSGGLLDALQVEPQSPSKLAAATGLNEKAIVALLDVVAAEGYIAKLADGSYAKLDELESFYENVDYLKYDGERSLSLSRQLLCRSKSRGLIGGWNYTDPELLVAQGVSSAYTIKMMNPLVLPMCPGLEDRLLMEGARILDVGSGVGQLSCALAELFDKSFVVGVDPKEDSNALAIELIRSKGLEDRVEIRQQLASELCDEEGFDFVWLPAVFLNTKVLTESVPALAKSMKPGAWLLTVYFDAPGDDTESALARLNAYLYGDDIRGEKQTAAPFLDTDSGFDAASYQSKDLGWVGLFVIQKSVN